MPNFTKLINLFRSNKDRAAAGPNKDMPCLGDKSKECICDVLLLDDTQVRYELKASCKGQILLTRVFEHLNLLETDYFGLRYLDDSNQTHWLDASKTLSSQLRTGAPHTLYFGVKFYAADPCKLHEEITRYQFFLQVKKDALQGRMPIPFDIAAELCAFAVQSELGDFDPKRHLKGYVSEFRFVPNQTEELEDRIARIHKTLAGQVPAVAEYMFLDKVKWLEMYGTDLHPVLGEGNLEYFVGLTPTGIVVFRNKSKAGNYFWPRISKVSFKGKTFHIRVKDKNNDESTYGFELATRPACKHLWKCAVEHHAFFRMHQATETVSTGKLFSLGSKNRYSGRSEKQSSQEPASRPQPHVLRTPSRRQQRRTASDVPISNGVVGNDDGGFLDYPDGMVTTVVQPKSERSHRQSHSNAADSPRSTRSAPWEMGNAVKGGMYTTGRDSPMSTRSEKMKFPGPRRSRESGSESEASYHHRRRGHHSRKSDNESDQERRRRRRSRHENSGSESEASHQRRYRHRRSGQDMLSSEAKWKEVQRKLEKNDMIASPEGRAHSMKSNGSLASDHGSEDSGKRKRRTRRRSRSPGKRPPEELRQHFEYDLVDPETIGLNEEQIRDIPYTKVETSAEPFKIKYSPHMRQRYKSPRRRSHGSDLNEAGMGRIPGGEPVPAHQQMYPPPTTQQMYPSNTQQMYPSNTQQQKYPSNTQQQKYPSNTQQHNRRSMPEVQYKNAYGHQNNGEEMVQPPPSVQKAELHTAPIVKTKPVAVFTALAPDNIPHPYPIMPLEDITNLSKNNKFSKPSDGKHQHHDSGLGIDQELSSSPKSNIGIAVSLKPKDDVNKYPVESTPKNGTSLAENGGRMRTRDAKSGPLNNRLSAIQGYQDEATSGYSKTVVSNIPQSSTCTGNSSMQSKSRQQETNSRPTYVEQVSNIPGNNEQNGQSSVLGSQQTNMLRAQESQKSQILASPVARAQDSPASQTNITPLMARLHDKGQHNYGSPTARFNVPGSRKDGVGQVNSAFTPVSGSTVSRKEVLNCSLSSELLSQVLSSSGRNKDIFTEL